MPEKNPSEEDADKRARALARRTADLAAKEKEEKKSDDQKPDGLDDPEPNKELRNMKEQRALADISKPIEAAAEAIWSEDPDKIKARQAIADAYRKAARRGQDPDSHGELRARYERVNDKFIDAAADMLRSRPGRITADEKPRQSHLHIWIQKHLEAPDGKVRKVLIERRQVGARLARRMGEREAKRQKAADKTKRLETAFGRWSAPDKEIGALIATYEGRIDQLNADINTGTNRDQAIFSFWFEVAPAHLQLHAGDATEANPHGVTDADAPGVEHIRRALADFDEDLLASFKSGKARDDGSLYLLDPDKPAETLGAKRVEILEAWQEAAKDQSVAEADYATRPDAAADLKPRYDKLGGDAWVKGARELLAPPKA